MPTEEEIYTLHASQYDRLIQREDFQKNILRTIQKITPLSTLDVIDLGSGTGRFTQLLAPITHSILAMDLFPHMLREAKKSLYQTIDNNWMITVCDNARLPVRKGSIDLVISGWSFCYLAVWSGDNWKSALQNGLEEIKRVLHKGGIIIILETMGTGFETPHPPQHLANYFEFLKEMGFSSTWIRTDYKFESLAEAEELSSFFFGEELTAKVRENQWIILPECTGVWWFEIIQE